MTPQAALANRIANDCRNLGAVRSDTSNERVAVLVADCAMRYRQARLLANIEESCRNQALRNLLLAAELWEVRNP